MAVCAHLGSGARPCLLHLIERDGWFAWAWNPPSARSFCSCCCASYKFLAGLGPPVPPVVGEGCRGEEAA